METTQIQQGFPYFRVQRGYIYGTCLLAAGEFAFERGEFSSRRVRLLFGEEFVLVAPARSYDRRPGSFRLRFSYRFSTRASASDSGLVCSG